jgi:plasmid stabilization system protein ParE
VNVRFLAEALADYEAAAKWYDEHSPDAGDEFAQAIQRAEWLLAEMPQTWPQWPGARLGVRRYVMPGLPYSLGYEIVGDEVVILGVVHQRRRPGFWFARRP